MSDGEQFAATYAGWLRLLAQAREARAALIAAEHSLANDARAHPGDFEELLATLRERRAAFEATIATLEARAAELKASGDGC